MDERGPRVLVVDDERHIVEFVSMGLEGRGMEVRGAADGRATLDNAATVTIAVNQPQDTTPPTVASVKPVAGQTGVSWAANTTVTVSERRGEETPPG